MHCSETNSLMNCEYSGEVYRGLWRQTDVAVKLLLEQDLPEKTVIDFKKEVSIMKKLRHPNILQFVSLVENLRILISVFVN